ncbi:Hypothetical protein FKW44_015910 [Caligus rogercresseyi]|uniref:Uncharacterized protein n=1 Tax=Caligus rogercresseyi TaxID=217165 RepID=A0A7T8H154_CALRO|nr:Hypothetical protein FKW44_015910 [Caligus rogercresseyi]
MPSNFFGKGQKVRKEAYHGIMKTVTKPWMLQVAVGKPMRSSYGRNMSKTLEFFERVLASK